MGETSKYTGPLGFLGSSNGKASACNAGDLGLIPGSERSPGMATHSNTLAWKIPWMEEPSRLESWDRRELDTTQQLHWLGVKVPGESRDEKAVARRQEN